MDSVLRESSASDELIHFGDLFSASFPKKKRCRLRFLLLLLRCCQRLSSRSTFRGKLFAPEGCYVTGIGCQSGTGSNADTTAPGDACCLGIRSLFFNHSKNSGFTETEFFRNEHLAEAVLEVWKRRSVATSQIQGVGLVAEKATRRP